MSRSGDSLDFTAEPSLSAPSIVGDTRATPSSISAGIIRVGAAKEIPSVLRDFGLDPDRTVAQAGVDPRLLDDPDNVIPFAALGHLITVCVARTGCLHFGLLVGQRGSASSLGAGSGFSSGRRATSARHSGTWSSTCTSMTRARSPS